MIQKHYLLLFLLLLSGLITTAQTSPERFQELGDRDAKTPVAFCVPNNSGTLQKLLRENIIVKSVTPNWVFIQASPEWIAHAKQSGIITHFYLENAKPYALNDTTRVTQHVNEVHAGSGGLPMPYTGKDVIIGYVDQGLDYNHPDFIDENGQTRVLYYWDHTLPVDAQRTPEPYGYGQLWSAADIENGICLSNEEASAHGTSVAGAGSSNGRANGTQKGMAPDSKIIVIETNFNLPNWTLTVADACDFVFKVADSLGIPAVVNLSVGSYLGSHDGNDPASELMEQLLDEKPGRIIVCAAGNSGSWGKYHVHGDVDADTSFVWLQNNPSGQIGANTVYFDLWTDLTDATWEYALGANLPSGSYEERALTGFRTAQTGVNAGPLHDTLYNSNGDRIAIVDIYPEIVGPNYHLEVLFSTIDSTVYNYSFKTTGSGNYDLWSGTTMGLNNIISQIPDASVFPDIIHYHAPDTLVTVVSSWNCSEKVISVGNVRNRFGHTDKNGNYYQPSASYTAQVGDLSPNSAKGPSRHGITKPDISACGDVSLSAGPMWIFDSPSANGVIDQDNWHVRNGGTSMASPVVAGIAALYLEKCPKGTYATFKTALTQSAFSDSHTGTVPNNAYGYGKAHALNTLLAGNFSAGIEGPTQFCGSDTAFALVNVPLSTIQWNSGATTTYNPLTGSGSVYYTAYSQEGCKAFSDTLTVTAGDIPPTPIINVSGNQLSTAAYPNLQWYENGNAINGATGNTLQITLPSSSNFTVVATGSTGCEVSSIVYNPSAGINENTIASIVVYPNPVSADLDIYSKEQIKEITCVDLNGNIVLQLTNPVPPVDMRNLASGSYLLCLKTENAVHWMKIIRK